MAPVAATDDLKSQVQGYIDKNKVMLFSKSTCPFCVRVKDMFSSQKIEFFALELDQLDNGPAVQNTLQAISGQRTVPNVYINGQHIGGCDDTLKVHREGKLMSLINPPSEQYDYDLIVIGGGSGGLAAGKEAAELGARVACLDFVKPSPQGSTWGLGGTCVNVGCIPKKLMHQAAILGHNLEDARKFGWEIPEGVGHQWATMRDAIQDHIGSLNWNYRVQLRKKSVDYLNSYGEFVGPHKLKCTNRRGVAQELTAQYFLLATGGRPRYPDIPGAKDYCITSDDLFSLPYAPGKTLVVGASYVSLECAGFLAALGFQVTVMVRSILLRGFDQLCAEKIGDYMANYGIEFIRPCVPTKVECLKKGEEGQPGRYRVTASMQTDGKEVVGEYNTVMIAVGRDPCTKELGLDTVGVEVNPKSGFIKANSKEQTSCDYIYAVGDILEGKPELTPVAIQAGRLLSRRLFGNSTEEMDYVNIPTTVFTPLEYGAIGLAEEDAIKQYGDNDIEVYHSNFWPLEWTVAHREDNVCYAKLICVKSRNNLVVGLHILGPNAGEITQGWTVGMKLGATKADFDNSVGIHPTCAEILTTLDVSKSSGGDIAAAGC